MSGARQGGKFLPDGTYDADGKPKYKWVADDQIYAHTNVNEASNARARVDGDRQSRFERATGRGGTGGGKRTHIPTGRDDASGSSSFARKRDKYFTASSSQSKSSSSGDDIFNVRERNTTSSTTNRRPRQAPIPSARAAHASDDLESWERSAGSASAQFDAGAAGIAEDEDDEGEEDLDEWTRPHTPKSTQQQQQQQQQQQVPEFDDERAYDYAVPPGAEGTGAPPAPPDMPYDGDVAVDDGGGHGAETTVQTDDGTTVHYTTNVVNNNGGGDKTQAGLHAFSLESINNAGELTDDEEEAEREIRNNEIAQRPQTSSRKKKRGKNKRKTSDGDGRDETQDSDSGNISGINMSDPEDMYSKLSQKRSKRMRKQAQEYASTCDVDYEIGADEEGEFEVPQQPGEFVFDGTEQTGSMRQGPARTKSRGRPLYGRRVHYPDASSDSYDSGSETSTASMERAGKEYDADANKTVRIDGYDYNRVGTECPGCMSNIEVHGHEMRKISDIVRTHIGETTMTTIARMVQRYYKRNVLARQKRAGLNPKPVSSKQWYIHLTRHTRNPITRIAHMQDQTSAILDVLEKRCVYQDVATGMAIPDAKAINLFMKLQKHSVFMSNVNVEKQLWYPKATGANVKVYGQLMSGIRPIMGIENYSVD